jgi:hypothetical protein
MSVAKTGEGVSAEAGAIRRGEMGVIYVFAAPVIQDREVGGPG